MKRLTHAAVTAALAGGIALAATPAAAQPYRGMDPGYHGNWFGPGDPRQGRSGMQGRSEMQDRQERGRMMRQGWGRGSGAGYGGAETGRDPASYVVIPDYFPNTPFYHGLQDYVLMPDYSRSMEYLFVAAQSLREAIQAMAQHPAGPRRNAAIDRAQEALLTTQAAMVQLPAEARTR